MPQESYTITYSEAGAQVLMTMPSDQKTAAHLINLILTRNGKIPNFSLLLGSGASQTSGVRTAQGMIHEWRTLLFSQSDNELSFEDWIEQRPWYGHDDEYSLLFEEIFDQPSQRRVYVEECVKDAHPHWGYVYLTEFLSDRLFDIVFTTNFDDLINEACYLYSEKLRPIVAAHDSAIQGVRVTSGRPKIIKLHGDFLYDDIKNTLAELETLESNTKRKLSQFAQEYGLVVIGYSGRDRSVMDTLDLLLRDDENYKQGIYWCQRRGAPKSNRLLSLLRRDRVFLVEVDGFDEFMADLHKAAGLQLPKPIARPFEMAEERARLFVELESPLKSHPVIGSHVNEVLSSIHGSIRNWKPTLPLGLEAMIFSALGRYDEAASIWKAALQETPDDVSLTYHYAEALLKAGRDEELVAFLPDAPLQTYNKTYFLLRLGKNQQVVDLATRELSAPIGINYVHNVHRQGLDVLRINRAIALKRLERTSEMMQDLNFFERNEGSLSSDLVAGIAALKGDKAKLFAALDESLGSTLSPKDLEEFPVFEDYQDEPEFRKLLASEGESVAFLRIDPIRDEDD